MGKAKAVPSQISSPEPEPSDSEVGDTDQPEPDTDHPNDHELSPGDETEETSAPKSKGQ